MATADELLMAAANSATETTEEILVADLNARVIGIPASLHILGVESDDDVKRLQFRIPRHYGEFDLSTFDIRVNFENARGKGDVYPVEDVTTTNDDHIEFTWLVDRTAFNYAGDVKFSLCMKLFENDIVVKELNTTYAILPVLKGLETEKAVVDQNPSAFDRIMTRLYAVEAATGNGKNGYYSVVKVDQYDSGSIFTIVNQDGETIAYVRHGIDGYTPVKGVDYWNNEDKSELVGYAKSCVDTWAPKYSTITLSKDGWSVDTQRVMVSGVTNDNIVIVSPSPSEVNQTIYINSCVRCVDQTTDYLTFKCDTPPTSDVLVNVGVFYSAATIESTGSIVVTDDGDGNVFFS